MINYFLIDDGKFAGTKINSLILFKDYKQGLINSFVKSLSATSILNIYRLNDFANREILKLCNHEPAFT